MLLIDTRITPDLKTETKTKLKKVNPIFYVSNKTVENKERRRTSKKNTNETRRYMRSVYLIVV